MQTKVSNNSKRYIYRKNALGRDKSVMGQMTGAVKNYIKQKNKNHRLIYPTTPKGNLPTRRKTPQVS